jgi:hypothetical protein
MYRTNEAALVSAVLERKLESDPGGVIEAAMKLWLVPEENAETLDVAHAEVWAVVNEMELRDRAIAAAIEVMERGEKIRLHAFIDIGESVADIDAQRRLAQLAIDRRWGCDHVLAALMRIVEANREDVALEIITANRDALEANTDTWSAVAALLTTTRVGKAQDLASWFASWPRHDGAPMWIAQAYAVTLMDRTPKAIDRIAAIAARAITSTAQDLSIGYHGGVLAMDDLHGWREFAFRVHMDEHGAALAELAGLPGIDHPAAVYLNRVKHAHPITMEDIAYETPVTATTVLLAGVVPFAGAAVAATAAIAGPRRPSNYKIGAFLADVQRSAILIHRALGPFVQIYDLPRGAPEVPALCVDMRKSRPSELPWLVPAWDRAVTARTSWRQRMMLALGL